jgi:hypothetical protein
MKKLFTNFKTTLFGSIAGLPLIVEGIQTKDVVKIISGVSMLFLGLVAKDHNTI